MLLLGLVQLPSEPLLFPDRADALGASAFQVSRLWTLIPESRHEVSCVPLDLPEMPQLYARETFFFPLFFKRQTRNSARRKACFKFLCCPKKIANSYGEDPSAARESYPSARPGPIQQAVTRSQDSGFASTRSFHFSSRADPLRRCKDYLP